jgi:hypothetical protein
MSVTEISVNNLNLFLITENFKTLAFLQGYFMIALIVKQTT